MSTTRSKYKTSWDLSPLLKRDNDPEQEKQKNIVEKETKKFVDKWRNRNDYLSNPSALLEALNDYNDWAYKYGLSGDYGYYFHLRQSQEMSNAQIKAKNNLITDSSTKIANEIQFFTLRLADIDIEDQKKMLSYKGLADYKHFLEKIFESAKYKLTEKEEKILNLKTPVAHSNWIDMNSTFINNETYQTIDEQSNKKSEKSFSELLNLLNSKNKKVRDSAVIGLNKIFLKHSDVAEHEINSILQNKRIDDGLRNYTRPDQSRHISDDINTKTVDQLIKAVSGDYKTAKRYYKLKAKLMKSKKLKYHERNVPYGRISKKYNFDEAVNLTSESLAKIDPIFSEILTTYAQNGNIDVFPKKGKRSGAFCSHDSIRHPTYILLNHTNQLNDVLTLAHELGHGINNELIKQNESKELNFGTSLATAEVASTFMEDFVLERLLADVNEEEKLAIMMMKLNDDISTIHRQIACYQFEQDLHSKYREVGYLPKADIGKLFQKNMKSYMGSYVEQSEGSENWWVYWGHIRYFFYVYSYASGLLISKSLQNSVKTDPKFILKVKEFLSTGTSKSPEDSFKHIGIDITKPDFWQSGLDEINQLLKDTEKLAKKLGKI